MSSSSLTACCLVTLTVGCLLLRFSSTIVAREDASGIVKERMQGMSAIRDLVKDIGEMLNSLGDFDVERSRTRRALPRKEAFGTCKGAGVAVRRR